MTLSNTSKSFFKRFTCFSLIRNQKIILLFVLSVCLSLVFQSRAFIFGYTLAFVFIFKSFKLYKLNKKYHIHIIIIFLLILLYVLTACFKTDSTHGRLLIYKISFSILKDSFPYGIGLNNFKVEYLNYQEDYFKNQNFTKKEFLLADNTRFAFNDYYQFLIEAGVYACLTLIISLSAAHYIIKRAIANNKNNPILLIVAIFELIAILSAAFMTYIFERIFFQVLLIACFLVILHFAYPHLINGVILLTISLVILIFSIILHKNRFIDIYLNNKYYHANIAYRTGYIKQATRAYKDLYPKLKYNKEFCKSYLDALLSAGQYDTAISILKQILRRDNGYMLHLQLAHCYFKKENYTTAEEEYHRAINMVPNRFSTRFELLKFYQEINNDHLTLLTCKEIISMPVKVKSRTVDKIKDYCKRTLKSKETIYEDIL